jgi:hypothetical protein
MKNTHLRRCPYPSSLRRTSMYASFLRISGALHLGIFDQPSGFGFFSSLQGFQKHPPERNLLKEFIQP